MRFMIAIAAALFARATAFAQDATIRITHDDPDGIVQPGQVVRISALLDWQNYYAFGATGGSVVANPALGEASNLGTAFSPSPTLTTLGTAVQGGVTGFRAVGLSPLFVPVLFPPYLGTTTPALLLAFDWTAPGLAGQHEFVYAPSAEFPLVRLFPDAREFPVPVSTAYIGTNLTVIPTPSVVAFLVFGVATAQRRRRAR